MKKLFVFIGLFIFVSCASKPVLYPNKEYKKVGKDKVDQDIELCMDDAEKYLDSGKGKNIAKGAGIGAILGGAMGAVSGIFRGDVVGGAVQGAAIGGTGGAVGGSLTPDQIKRRFVNQCLAKKGYRVIGWD